MAAFTSPEPAAYRYAPYVQELQQFFAESHLRCGSPEDVLAVSERLYESQSFYEDLSSMVRSIILREGGSMQHAALLEILALAIGGPEMEQAPQHYRQPLRHLLSFVTGVLRRPWNIPPGQPEVSSDENDNPPSERGEVVPFPSEALAISAQTGATTAIPEQAVAPAIEPAQESDFQHRHDAFAEPQPIATPEPSADIQPIADPKPTDEPEPITEPEPVVSHRSAIAATSVAPGPPVVFPSSVAPGSPVTPDFTAATRPAVAPKRTVAPEFEPRAVAAALSSAEGADSPAPSPIVPLPISPSIRKFLIGSAVVLLLIAILVLALRPRAPARLETHHVLTTGPVATPAPNPNQPAVATPSATVTTAPSKPTANVEAFSSQTPGHRSRTADADGDYVAPPTSHIYPGWNPGTPSAGRSTPSQSSAGQSAPGTQPAGPASDPPERSASSASERGTIGEARTAYDDWPGGSKDKRRTRSGASPYFNVSSGVMASNLISGPEPDYPAVARLTHTQGEVILQAVISKNGHVSATHVLSGHRLLRGAAVDAVRRWRYRPYRMNGQPVEVTTVITVGFHH